jgi:hypothetical protein
MVSAGTLLNPASIATLAVFVGSEGILLESTALQIQIVSSINPPVDLQNNDAAATKKAYDDWVAAGNYVGQLQQLQQGRQNHYQMVLQGS